MGRFELMKCYCYSSGGGGGRALRLISGFRHSAAATPRLPAFSWWGGKVEGLKSVQGSACRQRQVEAVSNTAALVTCLILPWAWHSAVRYLAVGYCSRSKP